MKQNPLRIFCQVALRTSLGVGILFGSMMPSAQADTLATPGTSSDKTIPFAVPHIAQMSAEPLPFTATELWEKMRSILSEPDSHVIVQRFEDMFDLHLGAVANFVGRRDQYGHFDVFVGRGHDFNLAWNTETFGNATKGECVNYEQVTKDVLVDGWQPSDTVRQIMISNGSYTKDKKILTITFSGQCVYGFTFWANHS